VPKSVAVPKTQATLTAPEEWAQRLEDSLGSFEEKEWISGDLLILLAEPPYLSRFQFGAAAGYLYAKGKLSYDPRTKKWRLSAPGL